MLLSSAHSYIDNHFQKVCIFVFIIYDKHLYATHYEYIISVNQ